MSSADQYTLNDSPKDCISCVRFYKSNNNLLVTSWDASVYLYNTDKNKLIDRYASDSAILCGDFISEQVVCVGGLECCVKVIDLQTKQERIVGYHAEAVSDIRYVESMNCIISCSWDKSICIWDPRPDAPVNPLRKLPLSAKAYCMDITPDLRLVVALDERKIVAYDLHNLDAPLFEKSSLLKFNLRTICALHEWTGYIVGSIEGRVGIEYFTETETQKPFSFRCHRKTDAYGCENIYPVNCIRMHPLYNTFATGGSDGTVNMWDGKAKKRLAFFSQYEPGVSTLAFNNDGTKMAIACSYICETGPDRVVDVSMLGSENMIYIRSMKEDEYKPKL